MKLLLVEDDQALREALAKSLAEAGVLVEQAASCAAADELIRTERYQVVVLDLGLPDGDGTVWLSRWRQDGIDLPVLILTARSRWSDKAAGFSAGADDYLSKPFEPGELLFRLRALVRRSNGRAHPVLRAGELALDTHSGTLTKAGLPVALTAQERQVLEYLLHRAPRVVSRAELAEYVYARDQEPDSNVIDVQISRLRRKLGGDAIETVRGLGYRVAAADDPAR
jgi:two-component system, OmpR family, response regulator